MIELTVGNVLFVVGVCVFTIAALYSDVRFKKISNKLNVSSLVAAILVRSIFFADFGGEAFYDGFLASLGGFAIGFAVLFVLWMIAGGGGGDVKFMAALGAWLGPRCTLGVLAVGAVLVVVLTIVIALWSLCTKGYAGTRKKYMPEGDDEEDDRKRKRKNRKPKVMSIDQRTGRRMMTYALPMSLATWILLALYLVDAMPKSVWF